MTSQTVINVIKLINIPEKNKVALKGTEGTYDLNHFGYFHPNIIKTYIRFIWHQDPINSMCMVIALIIEKSILVVIRTLFKSLAAILKMATI